MDANAVVRALLVDAQALYRRLLDAHARALAGLEFKVISSEFTHDGTLKVGAIFSRSGIERAPAVVPEGRAYPHIQLPYSICAAKNGIVSAAFAMGKICRQLIVACSADVSSQCQVVLLRMWAPDFIASNDLQSIKLSESYAVYVLTAGELRAIQDRETKICRSLEKARKS
jgi:hypothetical protein